MPYSDAEYSERDDNPVYCSDSNLCRDSRRGIGEDFIIDLSARSGSVGSLNDLNAVLTNKFDRESRLIDNETLLDLRDTLANDDESLLNSHVLFPESIHSGQDKVLCVALCSEWELNKSAKVIARVERGCSTIQATVVAAQNDIALVRSFPA